MDVENIPGRARLDDRQLAVLKTWHALSDTVDAIHDVKVVGNWLWFYGAESRKGSSAWEHTAMFFKKHKAKYHDAKSAWYIPHKDTPALPATRTQVTQDTKPWMIDRTARQPTSNYDQYTPLHRAEPYFYPRVSWVRWYRDTYYMSLQQALTAYTYRFSCVHCNDNTGRCPCDPRTLSFEQNMAAQETVEAGVVAAERFVPEPEEINSPEIEYLERLFKNFFNQRID